MEAAQVKCELNGESLEIQLKGEIDHHTAARIREEIDREVYFYRAPRVIIDLSHIDFMDSSGLGLILGRYTKLKDMGSELILKEPTEEIMKILKLAGVDKLIKIQREKDGGKILKVKRSVFVERGKTSNEEKDS